MASTDSNRKVNVGLFPWLTIILSVGLVIGAVVGGIGNPLLLLVGISSLAAIILLYQNIEWGLLALAFANYTMLSDILVKYHGLPFLSKYIVALLLLLLLIRWLLRREMPDGAGFAFVLMFTYGISICLSLFDAVDMDRAIQGISDYIRNAVIVIVITLILKRGDMLRRITYSVLAGGIFLGTISTYQYLTGTFDNTYWGFGQAGMADIVGELNSYRIGGPIGDPNFYGQLLLFVVPLALERLQNERSKLWRTFAGCALAVTLLSIAFTFSRGTFLAAGSILLLMLWKNPPRPAVLAASLALVFSALVLLMPTYLQRMYTVIETFLDFNHHDTSIQDSAITGRLGEMGVAMKLFGDHPLLGVGIGNYEHYYQQYSLMMDVSQRGGQDRAAHSLYLELAAERGLAGLAAYFVLIWLVVRTIMESIRKLVGAGLVAYADMARAYGYSLLGYLITSIFLHERSQFFWILLGICLSLPAIAKSEVQRISDSSEIANEGLQHRNHRLQHAERDSGNFP